MKNSRSIFFLFALWCCAGVPLSAQDPNCAGGTGGTETYTGGIFFNYGSVSGAVNSKNRHSSSIGEPLIGNFYNQNLFGGAGFWTRFVAPPSAPTVVATQGELLDRIQLKWAIDPLSPSFDLGFNIYRDSIFLSSTDKNARSFNDFNVIAGRPYNYEVRGVNIYGEGAPGKALGFQVPNGVVTGQVQTMSGSPVPDALVTLTPMQGFSLKFEATDGAFFNDTISILPAANEEWTLTFWMKTNSATTNAGLLELVPFPLFIRTIASSGGHEGIQVAQTYNGAALLAGQFPDSTKNAWHNIALSVDADGKGRLYIDGNLVAVNDLPPVPSATEIRFGSRTVQSGWDGLLDELRIYHRRLDEIDLAGVMMGTASSLTPGLKYYWKLDEEQGTKSFDLINRTKLYFCGAEFDTDRPPVNTSGITNEEGFYRIESVSYGTGTTFLARPSKDFYMYRALRFVRNQEDYGTLPDFSLTPKATLELWINNTGPDGDQCVLSKKWDSNDFRLLLTPSGNNNTIKFHLNGQEHAFGTLGMGYQHLAFTIDSSGTDRIVSAYKNGTLLGSHTFTGVSGNWSDASEDWMLGARPSGSGRVDYYGGLIDEVAVYDTTLSAASIQNHYQFPRDVPEKGLRVHFSLDEGSGNRLNNSGSVLLNFGTGFGTEWTPFAARQATTPHVFSPVTRQVTLNPSITSTDQVDFIDRSTVPVSGYVRYKNTDCFAPNVEILVNGESFKPQIFTDSTGRFLIDFNPGDNALLEPKFEGYHFVPAVWEVTNVTSPIAGILFNVTTTRKISGQVAGGLCKKSVIEAPPGMGMGTVCIVKVRSTDGCLEREITVDNQEGNFEFLELPPLESMTVAVVEHSNPDIKSAFQVQGGTTADLSQNDTIIDFIYFAQPQVSINSGLDTFPGCSPPLIVLDQGDVITLLISLVEQYVPIVDNLNMVLDDGVCPLDTADFQIINGFADTTVNLSMSNGVLSYSFRVGDPNPSPPYIKSLQVLGTSLAGRTGSLVTQAIVKGIRNKLSTFTTLLPETPSVVLRDPPGDGSYAFLEKGTTVCKTYTTFFDYEVGGGVGLELNNGGEVEVVVGVGVATIQGSELILGLDANGQVTYQKITDTSFQTCTTFTERIQTSDGDVVVGGDHGADIFMGEAINIIFGFADRVRFNDTICEPEVDVVLNVEPGTFATTFMYSQFHIENNVLRYLELLADDPAADSADVARYIESRLLWENILERNAGLKEKAKLLRNISFDSGISYEYSETSDTTLTTSIEDLLNSEESLETQLGYEFNKFGIIGKLSFVASTSDSKKNETGTQEALTTGYVLADDDPLDAFTVDVAMDSVYKTPVFRLKSGQSSCPWEPGTANREAPNLALALGSQFKAVNVPANEPAVFNFNLGNLSASNEDWTYGFTSIAANNPDGAMLSLNGQVLNNNTIQYIVPYGTSVPITLQVKRGPVAYEYDSLLVALVSECEMARNFALSLPLEEDPNFFSGIYIGVDFIRPCSEVYVTVPQQNWVVLQDDPVQPGTLRRITVSGYDLNSTDFQLVRVQYRRSDGDGAWINIPTPDGVFERYNPNWSGFSTLTPAEQANTLGTSFTQFFWETAGLGDGPYEVHAWAVCTGDASDKPGFSEIIKGRIDREPPSLVGVPQPSDGVYQVGDEISFTFNKHINCDKLIPADITQPNNVGLYDATTDELIDIDVTCFENKIVLDPSFQNEFFENRILRAELHGIEDLTGNESTFLQWEFFVDRNELAWLTDSLGLTKYEEENKTVTANIHNRGGYPVPYKILGVPDWLHVSPDQGTLAANEIRPINFTVNSDLAFGRWSDTILLETQTGQNPFFMGGSEPLPIGVRVVCRPPYGPNNFSHFENAMGMVLQVNIEGAFSTDPEDMVAAYIDDELRGLTNVQYYPQIDAWLAYLNVYGNPADMLKPLRLEVWDASQCERFGSVVESFTFQPDNVIGILTNPQIIHTGGLLLREVPFKDGWNWLSFNLAFPDNSPGAALASLQHPENDLIRSQSAFSEYLGNWFGSLTNLNNTSLYIYRADVPDTLRMQGTLIDPATTHIPLAAGWNWVGYVPNYALPINDALASLPAQFGDIAKGQYAFAQYINPTFGWVGTLKYMSPPNGYQIKLAQAGTLTYPPKPTSFAGTQTANRGEDDADIHHSSFITHHWALAPAQFEHTNTLIGMIRSNGANATTSNMELGAFVGDEVRGTAQAIYIEPLDAHLFFLTTYANTAGELLRFKLYDDATGTVRDLSETRYFAPNQHSGSVENPVPFELLTTSTGENLADALGFDVQPNPFSSETTLRFNLPKAEEVTLTISDAQGREVVRRPLSAAAGENVATWNGRSDTGSWLSSGVYLVRLQTGEGSVSRKVVLQRLP